MPIKLVYSLWFMVYGGKSINYVLQAKRTINQLGYTLIELLVVLTIIAILTTIAFVNYKTFSQDQVLVKAIGEIQSFLRLAQSNATAGVKCTSGATEASTWYVVFDLNKTTLYLLCAAGQIGGPIQKTLVLDGAIISSTTGTGCTANLPLTFTYSPLSGNVTLNEASCSIITITVANSQNPSSTKSFNISKGGAIDVQ